MSTPTPRFLAALEAQYAPLSPGERTCQETGDAFTINERDFAFYRSLGMPLPTVSPRTRLRRLRAMVAGFNLFRTTTPDGKPIITMFDSDCEAPIIPTDLFWNADAFNVMTYGRDYVPGESFFDQWRAFSMSVPRPAMIQDPGSENSPWALYGEGLKNCYFTYQGMRNVDLEYGDFCVGATSSSDVSVVYYSNDCHDSVQLNECSRAFFSDHCEECIDIAFCLGCRNCSDCFGCTNLRNKKFCFLNEQLTEEEYRRRAGIDLGDASVVELWKNKIRDEVWNKSFRLAGAQFHAERCLGDDLVSCQDVEGVSMFQAERVYNAFGLTDCKDTIDLTLGLGLERCANLVNTWKGYENKMTINCGECIDVEYSELCMNCEHCFGCIGLKQKKFCLFNKQYTEEEYWPLLDQVKTEMLARGEYGQFFPYRTSLWAYNTSHADAQFSLTEAEALALGARWYSFKQEKETNALPLEELPMKLIDTSDEILNKAYRCPVTGRAFQFVKPELERHRRLNVALPRVHPTVRRKERAAQLFWICVFPRTCSQCQKDLMSRIPVTHPSPILCETCYEAKVLA